MRGDENLCFQANAFYCYAAYDTRKRFAQCIRYRVSCANRVLYGSVAERYIGTISKAWSANHVVRNKQECSFRARIQASLDGIAPRCAKTKNCTVHKVESCRKKFHKLRRR